jgi:hypothetical protein
MEVHFCPTSRHIPGILDLFGSLATYNRGNKKGWMKKISDSIPSMMVCFAAQNHLGCCYCLLSQCAQNTFDSKMLPADRETSALILHDGEVGIHLTSKVPVSMKSELYQSDIVFIPTKFLCCQYTCPCGPQTVKQVMCVHNLPLLLNLSVFVCKCLGEHLLLKMAACWNSATVCGQMTIIVQ